MLLTSVQQLVLVAFQSFLVSLFLVLELLVYLHLVTIVSHEPYAFLTLARLGLVMEPQLDAVVLVALYVEHFLSVGLVDQDAMDLGVVRHGVVPGEGQAQEDQQEGGHT